MGILWASVQRVHCKCIHPHTILHNWQNLCLPTSTACLHFFFLYFFIYHKTNQNQNKTSILLSAEAVILRSLRLLVACMVTKFKKRIWSLCAAIALGSLLYFYLLSPCWSLQCDFFFFLWPLAWFSLVVLEYCCFKEMSEFSSFNKVLQLSCKICLWLPVSKRLFGFGMIRLLSLYCTKIMCSWTVCKLH